MKTMMTEREEWRVADGDNQTMVGPHIARRRLSSLVPRRGFTLVEMLVVIAIIAILASLLLPAIAIAKVHAMKTQAKVQISDLGTDIQKYDSDYSRMPISAAAQAAAVNGQFTYGGLFQTPTSGIWPNPVPQNYSPSNTELIAILTDVTNTTVTAVNANHQKNPQGSLYLNAKPSGWGPSMGGKPRPGIGNDLVYRDPWGNPYVVTMDLNDDHQCKDPFYSTHNVSYVNPQPNPPSPQQGYNALFNPTDPAGASDNFLYHGDVMIWSAGPDGKIDPTASAVSGANKDNIISWQ